MIALAIILAAFVLIASGASNKRTRTVVLAEIHAAEQRQIARERSRGLDANVNARWQG